MPSPEVIVVEDHPDLLDDLVFQLAHAGMRVRGAADGSALDTLLAQAPADVFVIDINLPGEDGFSITRRLREREGWRVGIILLTARSGLADKVHGLDGGADLYVVKPVDSQELAANIRSLRRRLTPAAKAEDWLLNQGSRRLRSPTGRELALTPQELRVMDCLLADPGGVVSRDILVAALGFEYLDSPEVRLNTLFCRLRKKLARFEPSLQLQTWRLQGYAYVGPPMAIGSAGKESETPFAPPAESAL